MVEFRRLATSLVQEQSRIDKGNTIDNNGSLLFHDMRITENNPCRCKFESGTLH